MKIQNVTDASFRKYGKVLEGYDFSALLKEMKHTPVPDDVVYVPSVEELEALDVAKALQNKGFGGIPIEIGYCNGHNKKLNAVEYHRSSEINVAVTDLVLLIGSQQDITDDFTYDTSKIEAFLVPAGTGIEVYATTLHYAPCNVQDGGFQCVVVLPAVPRTTICPFAGSANTSHCLPLGTIPNMLCPPLNVRYNLRIVVNALLVVIIHINLCEANIKFPFTPILNLF